jgi:hypothetical protein
MLGSSKTISERYEISSCPVAVGLSEADGVGVIVGRIGVTVGDGVGVGMIEVGVVICREMLLIVVCPVLSVILTVIASEPGESGAV